MNDADGVLNEELDTMFDAALQSFLNGKWNRIGSIMHWKNHRNTRFISVLIFPLLWRIPLQMQSRIALHADSLKLWIVGHRNEFDGEQ